MAALAGIKFQRYGRVTYCDPNGIDLEVGDRVLVETDDGPKEGEVAIAPDQVIHSELRGPLYPVIQKVDDG